jgi:multidrug resistance efflux pump
MLAAKAKRDAAQRLAIKSLGSNDEAKAASELVKALEAAARAEEAKLRAVEAADPATGMKLAEQEVEAKKAQLDKAEYNLRECTVRAPRDGIVLRVLVSEGDMLGPQPRQPAVQFCPAGPDVPRIVRAEVEQEFASRVALHQVARIQDDAGSETRWTGKVVRIGDWFTHRRSILLEPLQFNDVRTLECIIAVEPSGPPLRIGQRVRVFLEPAN